MRMLTQTLCLGAFLFLLSCTPSAEGEEASTAEATTPAKVVVATYAAATDYAGKTDYEFISEDGESFLVTNFLLSPDNSGDEYKIDMPDDMLEAEEDTEGVPGANFDMVGRKFRLYHQENDQIYKVELIENSKKIIEAEYSSAAVYAGMTEYGFLYRGDHLILVTASNDPDNPGVELPDNMLEEATGDLPGANPELVGKTFRLHYDQNGKVVKVE